MQILIKVAVYCSFRHALTVQMLTIIILIFKISFQARMYIPGRQVSVRQLETFHRRSPVSFTTANMATATKIIQRLRNLLSGVRNAKF